MRFRRRWANVEGARHPPRTRSDTPWMTYGRPARTKFMFGTKAAQRGVYLAPRGKCRPLGHGQLAQTSFHTRTKTVHGRCGRRMTAGADKFFAFGTKTAQWGVCSAPRSKCRLSAYERLVRTGFASGAKASRRFIRPAFAGRRIAPVSPVTRIQSPIKEKTQKNTFLQND